MYSQLLNTIDSIKTLDPLRDVTETVKNWLNEHPTAFKVVLIANQLMRAGMYAEVMRSLPYSTAVNGLICLGGTLFYRITIQGHCPYKLELTGLFGGASFWLANDRVSKTMRGVLQASVASNAITIAACVPLALYAIYVIITSEKKCCCSL